MRAALLQLNKDANEENPDYYEASFLQSFADTPLTQIEKEHGHCVAEAVRNYFIKHPSDRYKRITSGNPEDLEGL